MLLILSVAAWAAFRPTRAGKTTPPASSTPVDLDLAAALGQPEVPDALAARQPQVPLRDLMLPAGEGGPSGAAPVCRACNNPSVEPPPVVAAQPRGGLDVPQGGAEARRPGDLHGTSVLFLNNPAEAAHAALKEQKLLFIVHLSGNFEDPQFT